MNPLNPMKKYNNFQNIERALGVHIVVLDGINTAPATSKEACVRQDAVYPREVIYLSG